MKSIISITDLQVAYQKTVVLDEVTLEIPAGQITGIIGPNGSGKTTLLKSIMGLIPIEKGTIRILDQPLYAIRKALAYVPQRESVDWNFPASVFDVVAMGRLNTQKWWKRLNQEDLTIINKALEQVQLTEFRDRQIGQLSGGQQQRVFLARALAQQAQIILMDEPFVGVDMVSQSAILEVLFELRAQGKSMIIVHHDLLTVSNYFDYAILLNNKVVATGPTSEVLQPEILEKAYGATLLLNR